MLNTSDFQLGLLKSVYTLVVIVNWKYISPHNDWSSVFNQHNPRLDQGDLSLLAGSLYDGSQWYPPPGTWVIPWVWARPNDYILTNITGRCDGLSLPRLGYKDTVLLSCPPCFSHLLSHRYHVLSWFIKKGCMARNQYLQQTASKDLRFVNSHVSQQGSMYSVRLAFRWDHSPCRFLNFKLLKDLETEALN